MIRSIQPEELSSTIAAAIDFFRESGLPGKLDLSHWMATWSGLIQSKIGAIFVYESNGLVKGMIGVMFFPCPMTGDLEALEGFWYVDKSLRGGTAGIKLLKAFEEEAKQRGCKRIKMVHLMAIEPIKMGSIYTRMGYTELQRAYSKEL